MYVCVLCVLLLQLSKVMYGTNLQMVFNIGTYNVRGLRDFSKRNSIFRFLRETALNVICLQETHSEEKDVNTWVKEWGSPIYFSHGTRQSSGVTIMLRDKYEIVKCENNIQGRMMTIFLNIQDQSIAISNIYAPNKNEDQVEFYHTIHTILNTKSFCNTEIVLCGDFNLVLNTKLDKKGGLMQNKSSGKVLHEIIDDFNMHDLWRLKNPSKQEFTWSRPKHRIFCRLDMILGTRGIWNSCVNSKIFDTIQSDHKGVSVSLDFKQEKRGPGFYKFNSSSVIVLVSIFLSSLSSVFKIVFCSSLVRLAFCLENEIEKSTM